MDHWHFPGGPVVQNLLANAGDVGSVPGLGSPRAWGQPKPLATATEVLRACKLQQGEDTARKTNTLQPGSSPAWQS